MCIASCWQVSEQPSHVKALITYLCPLQYLRACLKQTCLDISTDQNHPSSPTDQINATLTTRMSLQENWDAPTLLMTYMLKLPNSN